VIVLYEVLTGALPFNAPTSEELARMHLEATPIPPSEYVPEIPSALEQIVLKVLSKEPAARYRTADQLGRVLLRFGTQRDVTPPPALSLTPEVASTYQRPDTQPTHAPAHMAPPPAPVIEEPETTLPIPDMSMPDLDWTSVGLGLLALMAVGGLIPFWIYIFFLYNPR
jgi:serine/threonine-protein kinase